MSLYNIIKMIRLLTGDWRFLDSG